MLKPKLKRDDKIILTTISRNTFKVDSKKGKQIFGARDDFFIYFKNVNFRNDGTIEGRYLGNASENLIDDYCKDVTFKNGVGFFADGKPVKTARMVAVNNKTRALIIIEN